MSTYTIGTATVDLFPEHGQAVVAIPSTWEGGYERDLAAAVLFLADSGMPPDPVITDMSEHDDLDVEVWVYSWDEGQIEEWDPRALSDLRRDAHGTVVPSELREAINMAAPGGDLGLPEA